MSEWQSVSRTCQQCNAVPGSRIHQLNQVAFLVLFTSTHQSSEWSFSTATTRLLWCRSPAVNPRAQELSEALIDICSSTEAGSKASSTTKQEIEELVRPRSSSMLGAARQCSAGQGRAALRACSGTSSASTESNEDGVAQTRRLGALHSAAVSSSMTDLPTCRTDLSQLVAAVCSACATRHITARRHCLSQLLCSPA